MVGEKCAQCSHHRQWACLSTSIRGPPAVCSSAGHTSAHDSWQYLNIYYKSNYLLNFPPLNCCSLYGDSLLSRPLHTSTALCKKGTTVEKSVKALKEKIEEKDLKTEDTVKDAETVIIKEIVEKDIKLDERVVEITEEIETIIKEESPTKTVASEKAVVSPTAVVPINRRIRNLLKSAWTHFKDALIQYYNGTKLLFVELRIALPLLHRFTRDGSSTLSRREYNQMKRTMIDLVRILPLVPMIIVPFMEFLIPLYIKLGWMPTTFQRNATKTEKGLAEIKLKLKKKLEMSKFLSDTLQNLPLVGTKKDSHSSLKQFSQFMEKVRSQGIQPSTKEIVKYAHLFENDMTLDNLHVTQLQALVRIMGLPWAGAISNKDILCFQLRTRLRKLEVDDRQIEKEGVDSLLTWELAEANLDRGMRAAGVTEERLKSQLESWLELHLKENVPVSLLLLSRAMYLPEHLSSAEVLKETISALPEKIVEEARIKSAEIKGEDIDTASKLKVVQEEQKVIKEERKKRQVEKEKDEVEKRIKEVAEAQVQADTAPKPEPEVVASVETPAPVETDAGKAEPIPDIAEPIEPAPSEGVAAEKVDSEAEITPEDLGDIEKAIEDITEYQTEELEDLREDLHEYNADIADLKTLSVRGGDEETMQESRGARQIRKCLTDMIATSEDFVAQLQKERLALQKDIATTETSLDEVAETEKKEQLLQYISDKKSNLVSVNEVMLSLKRLQKVPDDGKMARILDVLDEDKDGLIDFDHVLRVMEVLGRENLKMKEEQVSTMMDIVKVEDEIELEQRCKDKEEKLQEAGAEGKDTLGKNGVESEGKDIDTVVQNGTETELPDSKKMGAEGKDKDTVVQNGTDSKLLDSKKEMGVGKKDKDTMVLSNTESDGQGSKRVHDMIRDNAESLDKADNETTVVKDKAEDIEKKPPKDNSR